MSNRTCRKRYRRGRSHCLQLAERKELKVSQPTRRKAGEARKVGRNLLPGISGIRLMRGFGWRYQPGRWHAPRLVMRGDDPPGCSDRRAPFTGWPTLQACEFDGRLSLVKIPASSEGRGSFYRLYARANLGYGLTAGGRFVQTTFSRSLEQGSWARWQPIRLQHVNNSAVDLYFFAVQVNPSDNKTLLSLMPVSEPPWACVAVAFSRDGVAFSKPVNLLDSRVAFKSHESYAAHDPLAGGFSARAEDHPVANVVRDPSTSGSFLLYVHHNVKGFSYRPVFSYVAAYNVSERLLSSLTAEGLASLGGPARK